MIKDKTSCNDCTHMHMRRELVGHCYMFREFPGECYQYHYINPKELDEVLLSHSDELPGMLGKSDIE